MSVIFFIIASSGFSPFVSPALLAISAIALLVSSSTLSVQALSAHLHIFSFISVILLRASAAPPFFLQPKEAMDRQARNAIPRFFI